MAIKEKVMFLYCLQNMRPALVDDEVQTFLTISTADDEEGLEYAYTKHIDTIGYHLINGKERYGKGFYSFDGVNQLLDIDVQTIDDIKSKLRMIYDANCFMCVRKFENNYGEMCFNIMSRVGLVKL